MTHPIHSADAERAAFEVAMNAARFLPRELDFTRGQSPSGRDEYVNSHLQSCWNGWQARAAVQVGANGAIYQIRQVRAGSGVWTDVNEETYAHYTGESYQRRILYASPIAAGAPAAKPNVGFGPHARKMFEAARAFVRIANGTTDEAKSTQYFPEYRPVFGPNGKITGYTWVNAADAPKVSASGAPAETPKLYGYAFWDPQHKDGEDGAFVVRGADDPATGAPDHQGHVWKSRALYALAAQPAETPKPIYQRQCHDGSWKDTTLLGFQSWKAAGKPVRTVFATPAATIGAGEGKDALDAARYRWLREHWFLFGTAHSITTTLGNNLHRVNLAGDFATLDAALDAGIADDLGAVAAMRSKTSPGEAG